MVNKDLVKRKISKIQEGLNHLADFKDKNFEDVARDYIQFAAVKNILMEIIGRGIDINEHILSQKEVDNLAKLDYAQTFLALADLGVLPEDFAREISKSAGFRNAIVHNYDQIDLGSVYESIDKAVDQYDNYCRHILNYIERLED